MGSVLREPGTERCRLAAALRTIASADRLLVPVRRPGTLRLIVWCSPGEDRLGAVEMNAALKLRFVMPRATRPAP